MGKVGELMDVRFSEQARYDFACLFLDLSFIHEERKKIQFYKDQLSFSLEDAVLARLLQRINDGKLPVVLPGLNSGSWLIAAPALQQLEQVLRRIGSLLVPTYAVIDPVGHVFFSQKSPRSLQRLGAQLYPAGYYVLRFRKEDLPHILERFDLWMRLEEESVTRRRSEPHPTYSMLYERFRSALAAAQWEDAESYRQQLAALSLTSADNLLFLEIEQLAQQGRWSEIGEHRDFSLLVRMQMPRAVRAALLTAFHQTNLLEYEQQNDWQQALESFRSNQPKLGQLLTARLGLSQDPVVRVYAYQAALEQDQATLLNLMEESSSPETKECINQLLRLATLQGAQVLPEKPVLSAHALALEALYQHDYDLALHYASEITEVVERTGLLLQIAYHTGDAPTAEEALLSYWDLPATRQNELQQLFPSIEDMLDQLQRIIDVRDSTPERFTISDWLTWFERLLQEPNDPELLFSIDRLTAVSDERYWTAERILQLDKYLLGLIVDSQHTIKLPHVREVLRKLVQFFVSEETFPRSESIYQQLYETFYVALLENQAKDELHVDFILLRLAEAQLRQSPSKHHTILHNLKEWSGDPPIPRLEIWALEVFELMIDFGMQPGYLVDWYRSWVSLLLSVRTQHERTNLEGWRIIGSVIQPGQDLIQQLDSALSETSQQEVSGPIEELPPKYRIAIYSLQVAAAERARKLLSTRNPELDIRICTDEVLNKSAKINAQNADLVVLVTTAMKHALSYGIGPSLKTDRVVYSESSGSTSILRAIEEFARKRSKL